jgi:hypothetical protein
MILPISVILPTRNVMGTIDAHVAKISAWLPKVQQVIVVDSSVDGTLDFLREKLAALPNVAFHSRPHGLYESWNFAVRQAAEDFVYFSTVGDGIDAVGLLHLLEVARETDADMVLSPPEMLDDAGNPHDRKWPIHFLCEELRGSGVYLLQPEEAFILSTSAIPETVLGSSASNLYRREFLSARPFPEGWGHDADSAWMISNGMHARIALTQRCVSRFVVHAPPAAPPNPEAEAQALKRFDRMAQLSAPAARNNALPGRIQDVLAGWNASLNARNRQFLNRMVISRASLEARKRRIDALQERVDSLVARTERLDTALKLERAEAARLRAKVLATRKELAIYEQKHRKIFGVLGLYLQVKKEQFRRLLARFQAGEEPGI